MNLKISSNTISAIATGVTTGATGGVILAGLFAVQEQLSSASIKEEQVTYLKDFIAAYRDRMCEKAESVSVPDGTTISAEALRTATYRTMRQQLDEVLKHRTSHLSFDEVDELKGAFARADIGIQKNVLFDVDFCAFAFEPVTAIEWLNYPD